MKKIIALFLALVILTSLFVTGMAEEKETNAAELPLVLLKEMDLSIEDWFITGNFRAILTLTLGLELGSQDEDFVLADAIDYATYVGTTTLADRDTLQVAYGTKDFIYIVMYVPETSKAYYFTLDVSDVKEDVINLVMDMLMQDSCDEYHKNTTEDLSFASNWLAEVLASE